MKSQIGADQSPDSQMMPTNDFYMRKTIEPNSNRMQHMNWNDDVYTIVSNERKTHTLRFTRNYESAVLSKRNVWLVLRAIYDISYSCTEVRAIKSSIKREHDWTIFRSWKCFDCVDCDRSHTPHTRRLNKEEKIKHTLTLTTRIHTKTQAHNLHVLGVGAEFHFECVSCWMRAGYDPLIVLAVVVIASGSGGDGDGIVGLLVFGCVKSVIFILYERYDKGKWIAVAMHIK